MSRKINIGKIGKCIYLCFRKETFSEGDSVLYVVDRINLFLPWRSQRVLKVAGIPVLYSAVPLFSFRHKLLCYQYCADALKTHNPGFYQHVLVLGCGGGALPRWLLEEYPSLKVDIVDYSSKIISVCKKYFLNRWEGSTRLKYICADARNYKQSEYRYQFIFCDLFNGQDLASFVLDRNFAAKLHGMLDDDGFLIVNCGWQHMDEVKRVYQDVFEEVEGKNRPGKTEFIRAHDNRSMF